MFLFIFFLWQIVQAETCISHNHAHAKKKWKLPHSHWKVPETVAEEYGKWIAEYMHNKTLIKQANIKQGRGSDEDDAKGVKFGPKGEIPGLTLPQAWLGYGLGNGGVDPPPWALTALGSGKLDLCFLEPHAGYCTDRMERWGYNSFMAECNTFVYSGCGGNKNNFMTKKRCEEACHQELKSNCQKNEEYTEYS